MNRHELIDVGTVAISSLLLGNSKFFARNIDAPAIGQVVEETPIPVLGSSPFQQSTIRSVSVETPVGTYEASFLPWQWQGPTHPTVIYHHGSGERPFDFGRFSANSFRRLFDSPNAFDDVNLVAIQAPFHDRSSRAYARSMGDLSEFVGMLASSVALVEALDQRLNDEVETAVTVSGISLGGWVTNLHQAAYGTADQYLPIFAGAALGEMFVSSAYRRMTGALARQHPRRLRNVLDFEDTFRESQASRCFPLLARYDRIIDFDRQQAAYNDMDLAILEKGHITGSLATTTIRGWLERHVARTPARR